MGATAKSGCAPRQVRFRNVARSALAQLGLPHVRLQIQLHSVYDHLQMHVTVVASCMPALGYYAVDTALDGKQVQAGAEAQAVGGVGHAVCRQLHCRGELATGSNVHLMHRRLRLVAVFESCCCVWVTETAGPSLRSLNLSCYHSKPDQKCKIADSTCSD